MNHSEFMRRYICFVAFAIAICLNAVAGKKAAKPIRVACIGNSITFGYGLQDPAKDSYPTQLEGMLNGSNGLKYEVGNFGRSSATLARHGYLPYFSLEQFRNMMAFHPDIAIIHLGINDTDPRVWPCHRDEFVRDYLDLIDSVKQSNPKCRIIMALMSPITDRHKRFDSGTRQWFFEIQDHIRLVAKLSGCQLIDFYTPLHNRPDLFPDRLHPTKEGYGIIAKTVYQGITGDFGGLQLPPYWGDNMVLPRNRKFKLEGMANAGDVVSVKVQTVQKVQGSQLPEDTVGLDGKWSVEIDPLESGKEYTVDVKATHAGKLVGHQTFTAVAGELWLASGQSNMAFQLKNATGGAADIASSANDQIRILNLRECWETDNTTWSETALDSVNHLLYYKESAWQKASPETTPEFSAVAYYFARTLQDSLHCPIGIICDAIGGSGIESWIDRGTLEKDFPAILRNWTQNDFLQDWVRGRALKNMGLEKAPNEFETGYLQRHPYQPCYLYEASIDRLKTLPISGIIWYQGESNAHNWTTHEKLFGLLLHSWRKAFLSLNGLKGSRRFQKAPEGSTLPFIYAQLSSLNRGQWTWFRDSQRKLQHRYEDTYMVVTSDKGDSLDVHPRDKQPVGYRMALRALRNVYGHRLEDSGPVVDKASVGLAGLNGSDGLNVVVLSMKHADGLTTSDGKAPATFEVAETEGLFHPATATIQGDRIVLSCPEVRNARIVRYGWQPYTRANVVNGAGLPMSTFRMNLRGRKSAK